MIINKNESFNFINALLQWDIFYGHTKDKHNYRVDATTNDIFNIYHLYESNIYAK